MPLYPAVPAEHPEIAALVNSAYRATGPDRGWTTEADYIDGERTAPATLARDLVPLLAAGYRLEEAHLVDLFPQTYHLETVVQLVR